MVLASVCKMMLSNYDTNLFDPTAEPEEHLTQYKVAKVKFNCEYCKADFTSKNHLKRHIESVHLGFKFPCNLCKYEATAKRSLQSHIESKHEGKKYPCPQCKLQICDKSSLRKHIRTVHMMIRAYPCLQCGQKFSTKNDLNMHIESRHGILEKNISCTFCDFKTNMTKYLTKHLKMHNKDEDSLSSTFPCDLCGYKTSRYPHLKIHKRSVQ